MRRWLRKIIFRIIQSNILYNNIIDISKKGYFPNGTFKLEKLSFHFTFDDECIRKTKKYRNGICAILCIIPRKEYNHSLPSLP